MATDLRQTHFRFGIEELLEATHGWYATEDVNVSLPVNTTFLLRFVEQEVGGTAAANTDAVFQYNKNGAGWVDITTTSSVVKAVASVAFTNGQACTKRLSGTGTFETTGVGCTEDGSSGGAQNDIVASGNSETECALQIVGTDVIPGDTIQLRFRSPDWTITYTVTPTLTVSSGNVICTPGTASLTTTLYIPTASISDNITVIPGILALTLTLYVPAVTIETSGITVTPGTASLITTLYIPVVTATANITVVPGILALTITKYTPSVTIGTILTPNTLALILTTYTPIISISQNVLVTPGLAIWSITPFTPLVLLFTTYGGCFLWTAANWGSVNIYLEVFMRATTGTVYSRLVDSNNNVVTDSELSTALTTFQRLRSSALTLTNGETYRNQFGKETGNAGEFLEARMVIIPA